MQKIHQLDQELKNLFLSIDPQEHPGYEEVMLLMNILKGSHNYNDENEIFKLIAALKGNSSIVEWDSLVSECKTYVADHPKPKGDPEDVLSGYAYITKMFDNTSLYDLILKYNVDILYKKLSSFMNMKNLYHFISYAYLNRYLINKQQCTPLVFELASTILKNNRGWYPYIHACEILRMDLDSPALGILYHFSDNARELRAIFDDDQSFHTFFLDLTGIEYDVFRQRVLHIQKERDMEFEREMRERRG